MKYFLVEVNENYIAPEPMGWHGIIDKKTLSMKKTYEMPKHLLFYINKHMQMVFTDVITFPCFMVSEMVRDVIKKYEPYVYFVRIILFDKEQKKSMAYYIPFLDKVECLKKNMEERRYNRQLSVKKESIEEKVIVEIEDTDGLHVIMRLDLVESILRRGAVGIGLKEVSVI